MTKFDLRTMNRVSVIIYRFAFMKTVSVVVSMIDMMLRLSLLNQSEAVYGGSLQDKK